MMKLAISGCRGRMGQSITRLALKDKSFMIATLLEYKEHPNAQEPINDMPVSVDPSSIKNSDVLIEFTLPEGTMINLQACVDNNVKMVIGTTGLKSKDLSRIREASKIIPIVLSGNMSLGVNILFKLTQMLAKVTPNSYVAKITEAHHIHKKDAPSGTAKMLEEFIDMENFSEEVTHDRERLSTESIREGEIVGDHTVIFESDEDIIMISHHAKSRDIFAKGALVAAKFLADKENGLFNMQDVLGLG